MRNRFGVMASFSSGTLKSKTTLAVFLGCYLLFCAACSRPQQAAQEAPLPPIQYLGEWGTAGTDPAQFQNPQTMAVDSAGNVFVGDARDETTIEKFDETGHPLLSFVAGGTRDNWDLGIDPGQAIFVVDPRGELVQIFTPEGEHFRTLHLRYRRWFKSPASIAMESEGNFFLADMGTGIVANLNAQGHLLAFWGKPAGMPAAHWMPCRIRLGLDGNLYLADVENQKVVKVTSDGRYLTEWDFPFSALGPGKYPQKAYGLAVWQTHVVTSDEGKRLIQIWTLDGALEETLDLSQHPEWGERATATDVAFTPKGEMLVLDRGDARVLRFRLNIPTTAPSSPNH